MVVVVVVVVVRYVVKWLPFNSLNLLSELMYDVDSECMNPMKQ